MTERESLLHEKCMLTVVENRNDQDHEGREVELPDEGQQQETEHDTDGDRHSIDGVVLHALQRGEDSRQRNVAKLWKLTILNDDTRGVVVGFSLGA